MENISLLLRPDVWLNKFPHTYQTMALIKSVCWRHGIYLSMFNKFFLKTEIFPLLESRKSCRVCLFFFYVCHKCVWDFLTDIFDIIFHTFWCFLASNNLEHFWNSIICKKKIITGLRKVGTMWTPSSTMSWFRLRQAEKSLFWPIFCPFHL